MYILFKELIFMALATVQKWGNSHGVRIPKHLLDSLNWSIGEKISLRTRGVLMLILLNPANLTGVNLWGVKYGKSRRHY